MTDITTIAQTTKALIADHFATLLGERPFGSQWGRGFTEADFGLDWREESPPDAVKMEGCRYFRLAHEAFTRAFPGASLGAVAFCDLPEDLRARVEVAEGAHGPELRIHQGIVGRLVEPFEAWLIIGDHEGHQVIFTAHPGLPLAPYRGQMDPTLPIAVKVV